MPIEICSIQTLDKPYCLSGFNCVLTQVALWGKGMLYALSREIRHPHDRRSHQNDVYESNCHFIALVADLRL